MLDEIKKVLLMPYNSQLDEYNDYKAQFDELQDKIIYDSCEKDYQAKKQLLKSESKNISKEELENKKQEIMKEYKQQLDAFNKLLDEYNIKKAKLASWNVYEIKRQIKKINTARNLEELGLTIEQAKNICNENGIEFRIDLEQM